MPERNSAISAPQIAVAVCLTCMAGFVDAFGYITLEHVYTANMSGNTVGTAVYALGGEPAKAFLHAYSIAMFLLGLLVSGVVIEFGHRHRVRRMFAVAMTIEVACLAPFALLGGPLLSASAGGGAERWPMLLLIALAAAAMGTQNTALRMSGILTVYTTHVTGTITKFSEDAVTFLFAALDRRAARQPPHGRSGKDASGRAMLFSAVLWLGFLAGGVLAAWLAHRWRSTLILFVPIAMASAVAGADWLSPLSESGG